LRAAQAKKLVRPHLNKKPEHSQAPVAHTCNPSSRPAQANKKLMRLHLANKGSEAECGNM
jgi:hypothetical protein